MSRWDRILDQKPQELKDYVLDQVAALLADEVRRWPPRLDEVEGGVGMDEVRRRYARALARGGPLPRDTLRVGLELAREEMLREYELIDRFCRSPDYRALLRDATEEETAHLLSRFVVDSALEFQDFARGKFRRSDLVLLVEKLEGQLLQGNVLRL